MVTVDDKHRRVPLEDVFGGRGVPDAVVVAVVPVGAVVLYCVSGWFLRKMGQRGWTYLMLSEPQLFRVDLRICDKAAVVANQGFELAAQVVTLDPVDHETAVTGSRCYAVVCVDEVKVVVDIFPTFD